MDILVFTQAIPTVVDLVSQSLALVLSPLLPRRGVLVQGISSQDTVTRSVLDIDVEVIAAHCDDHVEVYLQLVRNTLLDGERM
jgi:hypothetical protein